MTTTMPSCDGLLGIDPSRPLKYVAESYRQATRSLTVAHMEGVRGYEALASLGLRAAVTMDSDVNDIIRTRYLDPLLGDPELISTLRVYLSSHMDVERTAARLVVDESAVRHRIARIQELTGVDLGESRVVIELWWALALSEFGSLRATDFLDESPARADTETAVSAYPSGITATPKGRRTHPRRSAGKFLPERFSDLALDGERTRARASFLDRYSLFPVRRGA